MAGFIPKEQLSGFQRWQVTSFDQPEPTGLPAENLTPTPVSTGIEDGSNPDGAVVEIPFPTAEEIEKISEEARAEGFKVGYEEGKNAGEAELGRVTDEKLQQLSTIIGNLHVSIAHLDQEIAEQLLDLSLEVASQVLRSSLSVRRELLLPTIKEAVAALPLHHGTIALHLNPDDALALSPTLSEQLLHTGAHIISDTNISPGGCHITAGNCDIDATIETRWKRVLEAIGASPKEWMPNL